MFFVNVSSTPLRRRWRSDVLLVWALPFLYFPNVFCPPIRRRGVFALGASFCIFLSLCLSFLFEVLLVNLLGRVATFRSSGVIAGDVLQPSSLEFWLEVVLGRLGAPARLINLFPCCCAALSCLPRAGATCSALSMPWQMKACGRPFSFLLWRRGNFQGCSDLFMFEVTTRLRM